MHIAGLHPQSFWSIKSGVGPRICGSKEFPGDLDVTGPWPHFENHYPKKFISGKSESFKTV